jgi:hypothetical protein
MTLLADLTSSPAEGLSARPPAVDFETSPDRYRHWACPSTVRWPR